MVPAWLKKPRYLPLSAPLKGGPGKRSRGVLMAVVAQFQLETTPRYQPGPGSQTWCNIALWDLTSALGCEIPHWADRLTGRPTSPLKGVELRANDIVGWLEAHGQEFGWQECPQKAAAEAAEIGAVAVAVWRNPDPTRSGHVALLMPAVEPGRVYIAQAGGRCFTSEPLEHGFGHEHPTFYRHN